MASTIRKIDDIKSIVREVAEVYGVEKVTLFGSYARGEAVSKSDIDLRIDRGKIKGLIQLSGFQLELEDRLNAPVDIVITDSLDTSFLEVIGKEEIVLYEQ
jgi:predicted nucleotidyltransferase